MKYFPLFRAIHQNYYLCLLYTSSAFLYLGNAKAQQVYTWDEYGISFTLADDFKESVNNIDEFSATGDGMELAIIPFKDETIDDTDINAYTMSIAASLKLQRVDDISVIEFNGFKGGYAEGALDGARIFIMGLIDPTSCLLYTSRCV